MTTRILIVDDVKANRELLERRLGRRGFETEQAEGGIAALELIASNTYDLILLDLSMPDLDGIAVLEKVRESFNSVELPIIIVSAHSDRERIALALNLGANDFISKPVDFHVAFARIQTHLQLKNSADELQRLANDKAKDHAEMVNAIFNQAQVGIITMDVRGIIKTFNPGAATIFKCVAEEAIGQSVNMFLPEAQHARHDKFLTNSKNMQAPKVIGLNREIKAYRSRQKDSLSRHEG